MIATPAPVWKRALAWVYDGLIIVALVLVAGFVASLLAGGVAPSWLTQGLVIAVASGYFWLSWVKGGQTAGMRAWRLRVVTPDGKPLSPIVALTRLLACLGTLAPLGILLATAWFSPTRQTLYDRMSNTRVVAEPKIKR